MGLNALALGTLVLEDSDDAVAPEQAVVLLPLWEVLQSGGLKNQAENDAVLKQIEGEYDRCSDGFHTRNGTDARGYDDLDERSGNGIPSVWW